MGDYWQSIADGLLAKLNDYYWIWSPTIVPYLNASIWLSFAFHHLLAVSAACANILLTQPAIMVALIKAQFGCYVQSNGIFIEWLVSMLTPQCQILRCLSKSYRKADARLWRISRLVCRSLVTNKLLALKKAGPQDDPLRLKWFRGLIYEIGFANHKKIDLIWI